jgi:hypothetical protein
MQFYYVFVLQLGKNGDLSVSALRIYIVLKGVEYLFERVLFVIISILHLPDVPVCPTP